MTKYYKATTNVSVSVVLPNKKSLRISFTPLSDGTSTYQTNRGDVQTALEQHYKFGKLFRLVRTEGAPDVVKEASETPIKPKNQPAPVEQEAKPVAKEVASEVQPVEEQAQEEEEQPEEEPEPETKLRKVKVSDLATAKDYLADKFGISRTTLRSHKSILAQAEAHGIVFVGI